MGGEILFGRHHRDWKRVRQMGNGLVYRAERDPIQLMARLPAILALANGEKEALGFLPEEYDHVIARCPAAVMVFAARGGLAPPA